MILSLQLSIAGLARGTHFISQAQDCSLPPSIGASRCGAFAAIIATAGRNTQRPSFRWRQCRRTRDRQMLREKCFRLPQHLDASRRIR